MSPIRILVLTPWAPYPPTGACQQDRFLGCQQLKRCGYDVHVLAKIHDFQDRRSIEDAFRRIKIPLTLVRHPRTLLPLALRKIPSMLMTPALLDGAALEYTDPVYEDMVRATVERLKPDVVWMEYTTHWPVLRLLRSTGIPCIMKSSLNEPQNCRDEHGNSLLSRIKSIPKYWSERIAAQESAMILAITPEEERWYRSLGAKRTDVLPLRGLSACFTARTHHPKDVLDVVFLSSNYNMGHNRDALRFLLQKILPLTNEHLPGKLRFHLTGKKFRSKDQAMLPQNARVTGFIDDLGPFLATMDIALCPWISGAGMQQKVFEPLCRGLPLLTTKTAGYPFTHGEHLLLCQTPQEYVDGLTQLLDPRERNRLASAAQQRAHELFSEEAVSTVMQRAIEIALETKRGYSMI